MREVVEHGGDVLEHLLRVRLLEHAAHHLLVHRQREVLADDGLDVRLLTQKVRLEVLQTIDMIQWIIEMIQ
jgi:hypothetical protein